LQDSPATPARTSSSIAPITSRWTLTLWDSEEAVLSSDQTAEASRASTVAATGVELVKRDRYEVVTQA
jgi:hypothetical protein